MPQAKPASRGKRPSKAVSRTRNRRGVVGSVDWRIASRDTVGVFGGAGRRIGSNLAEYGAVSGPQSR
jgi:hypothetical protein